MINSIDLKKIFKDTWGYVGLPFPEIVLGGIPTNSGIENYGDFKILEQKKMSKLGVPYYAKNSLGREIYMPIWLSESDKTATEYLLPNTVMSISSKKETVSTKLVNRDGSFKEEISMDDWEIDIKGVIVSKGNSFPEDEYQLLNEWYKKRKKFNILNARTAFCLAGDEKVVISSLRFSELRGFENVQPYELKLTSDLQFSLYIDEKFDPTLKR
jgi:hypothetical protein